jgi:hypothetical protein
VNLDEVTATKSLVEQRKYEIDIETKLANFLLAHRCGANTVNQDEMTPVDVALKCGKLSFALLLMKNNGSINGTRVIENCSNALHYLVRQGVAREAKVVAPTRRNVGIYLFILLFSSYL